MQETSGESDQVLINGIDGVGNSGKKDLECKKLLCESGENLDGFGPVNQAVDSSKPPLMCEGNNGSFSEISTPLPKKS